MKVFFLRFGKWCYLFFNFMIVKKENICDIWLWEIFFVNSDIKDEYLIEWIRIIFSYVCEGSVMFI